MVQTIGESVVKDADELEREAKIAQLVLETLGSELGLNTDDWYLLLDAVAAACPELKVPAVSEELTFAMQALRRQGLIHTVRGSWWRVGLTASGWLNLTRSKQLCSTSSAISRG